jgi:hypothetical protein
MIYVAFLSSTRNEHSKPDQTNGLEEVNKTRVIKVSGVQVTFFIFKNIFLLLYIYHFLRNKLNLVVRLDPDPLLYLGLTLTRMFVSENFRIIIKLQDK